jgi:hypothetical protein
MALKVLLLNFPKKDVLKVPDGINITQATIEDKPTLHDYHAIIMDTDEILDYSFWPTTISYVTTPVGFMEGKCIVSERYSKGDLISFRRKVEEQIETGGVTFCFSSSCRREEMKAKDSWTQIDNYFFCPIDLGVVNESGDTFYPKFEELKYFTLLIRKVPLNEIYWSCYFSNIPKNARVLGVNRAGYSVFMEVPLGAGKLVMLPRFKNRAEAVTIIVNEIIPQIIHEEEFAFVPQWLQEYSSPYETQLKNTLKEIEQAKRILFTKDKLLKKAVAFAFEKIGFNVEILPDGTLPDLRVTDEEAKAIVEVKGHENAQSNRQDVLQILGYISETDAKEKGIVVSNHEFSKEPNKRSKEAFTNGAIQLAEKNDITLISSVDLYNVVIKTLEGKLGEDKLKRIRNKIISENGLVKLI